MTPLRPRLSFLIPALLAACSSGLEPAACHSDDTCPAASRCQGGVCVADSRPVASIRPPGAFEAFALVELDGSPSHDPDGGDDLAEHLWSVRAVTARCAAPAVAGRTPVARVRFGCEGRYEISLTVVDRAGLVSEPEVLEVEAWPSSRAPTVLSGADLASEHLCEGEPLACRATERLALSSSAPAGTRLRWTVEPPLDRPLDGTRRVTFDPGPEHPAPAVSIETDGTAISGDWIFRVEAHDDYGPVGAANTRVSVSNRPPLLIVAGPASVPHAFDAVRSRFLASGEVGFVAVDPDGDPLLLGGELRHVGDGDSSFQGELLEDRVTFQIEVPYQAPEDALHLIGGPELERTVEILAVDVNRVSARAAVPIAVANRAPAPVGAPGIVRVPHRFDAAGSRYVAVAELGAWADPDGDPLWAAPGLAPCADVSIEEGVARVECSVPYEGVPAAERIAGRHEVPVRVRDPWSDASAVAVHSIEILNSPPTLSRTVDVASTCVQLDVDFFEFWCKWRFAASPVEFIAFPTAIDPDGDPLLVSAIHLIGTSASPASAICTAPECTPFHFVQPAITFPCLTNYSAPSLLRATDGAAAVTTDATPPPRKC